VSEILLMKVDLERRPRPLATPHVPCVGSSPAPASPVPFSPPPSLLQSDEECALVDSHSTKTLKVNSNLIEQGRRERVREDEESE
jgi:hypothetical protein